MKTDVVQEPPTQTLNLYEFVTPSDPITFKAKDDNVARAVTLMLGNGKAFCTNDQGETLNGTCFLFQPAEAMEAETKVQFGMPLGDYLESEREAIRESFESFAYGSLKSRRNYDDAISAITDPEKLKEFKDKHEDRNRSSMNAWVKHAWKLAAGMKAKATGGAR